MGSLNTSYDSNLVFSTTIIFSVISTDHSKGFGGKFGVQKDKMDKVFLHFLPVARFSANRLANKSRLIFSTNGKED